MKAIFQIEIQTKAKQFIGQLRKQRTNTLIKHAVILLGASLAMGCVSSDPTADLQAQLQEINDREGRAIPPPPEFRVFESYVYGSSNIRSPFVPQLRVVDKPKERPQGKSVTPDFDRPPGPLEEFGVDQLLLVGTIQRPGGPLIALVKDDNKVVHQVKTGTYIGRNHGKVQSVTDTQVEILELIPEGKDLWIERPRTMWLAED